MESKILIITGMHRSGTSLMAEYLNKCGLYVGSRLVNLESINTESVFNGHHEDEDFLNLHMKALRRVHVDSFPTWSLGIPVRFNKGEKNQALQLVKERDNVPCWGWKDPRTTLFLNAWEELLPEAKYFFLIRDPLAVVDSLIRRGTDKKIANNPVVGLKSWKIYNLQILSFWKEHSSSALVFDIDQAVEFANEICPVANEKLGLDLYPVPFETVFSKKAFKAPNSKTTQLLKQRHPRLISSCYEIYSELKKISMNTHYVEL